MISCELFHVIYYPLIHIQRPSVPSTRQQLLHKVTPILPPNSYKSYHSGSSHLPTSPNHADSAVNSAGYESTNVESSESDGYEDVMSGDEDGTAVKSPWTFGGKTTSPTTVAEVSNSGSIKSRSLVRCV